MDNIKSSSITILLVAVLAGCATPQPQPGLPSWDYERDELKIQDINSIIGSAIGGLLGTSSGLNGSAVGAVKGAQQGINLTASELSGVIFTTLTRYVNNIPQMAISFGPVSLNNEKNSWSVSDSHEGQITTDWKRIPGKKAGILWWQKEYEAEVRHTITINQSFRSPSQANYSILTEVRDRPNGNYEWVKADPELGRHSFEEIKNLLLISVQIEAAKKRPRK